MTRIEVTLLLLYVMQLITVIVYWLLKDDHVSLTKRVERLENLEDRP